MKRLIGIVGILLLVLVVVNAVEPSFFEFLNPVSKSPLPDTTTVYAYGPGGLVSKQKGSEVSYYHKDHLGSSSLVTDESGVVKYSTDYYPFGSSLHEEGEEKYTYNSKELDNTGLYYYGARYYDASVGRFISVDPVAGNIYNPQRLNRYSYVLNNPLKYVDVNGESPKALIYVADQYHGEVLYNVNDHVLNAVFWFKESYESLGYDVELVTVRHSGVVGDKLTLRLHESGAGVISLGSERGAYYHALGEEEYDIVAIMAHSRALEGGGTVVDLSYGGWTTRVQPTSNFNQKTQGGCLEVYGCALGGVGGSVLIRSYPKFAKLRKHYSYEEILEKTQSGRGYLLNGGAPEANLIFSAPKSPRLIELESKFMLETLEIYQEFYGVPIPEPQFRNLGYADNKLEIPELDG